MSSAIESPLALSAGRPGEPVWFGVPTGSWVRAALLVLAFVAVFRFNLHRLWDKTNPFTGDPNWSHSVTVPAIGLYYLLMRRDDLSAAAKKPMLGGIGSLRANGILVLGVAVQFAASQVGPAVAAGWGRFGLAALSAVLTLIGLWQSLRANWRGSLWMLGAAVAGGVLIVGSLLIPESEGLWIVRGVVQNFGYVVLLLGLLALLVGWGLATLIGGLLLSAYGIWPGRNDFVKDVGMIVTLFGIVLTLYGPAVMKIAWFPIAFLVCALPWPDLVYSQVASPLQALAAKVSVGLLQMIGMDAHYNGTKIFIPQYDPAGHPMGDRALNVAEACAGLRSLMTFISVGAAVAFLSGRPLWQKLVITASAVPIAISCNVARVAGQGIIDTYIGREWSEGFAHQFAGMVMLLPAFFLIMLVCWVVDHLFIEEADEKAKTPAVSGGVA